MAFDHPLTFEPVLVPKPWGGDRLGRFGRRVEPGDRIGESWDVADLDPSQTPVPDPVSRVRSGPAAGRTLAELIAQDAAGLLGGAAPTSRGRFPLLVKLLDARETLSVQVHPPRSLAPEAHKTESWVVVDAAPGASLLLGVRDGVTCDEVVAAMGSAALLDLVREVPVAAGDVVHLPAGTIHALGAGVLVAEVQTTSDTTYRVWDWPDDRGGGRELHVERAREAVTAGWEHNLAVSVDRAEDGVLVDCDAYVLERVTVAEGEALPGPASDAAAVRVAIAIHGRLGWDGPLGVETLSPGGVAVLPASSTTSVVAREGATTVVVATPA